jgi:hypothetical protein
MRADAIEQQAFLLIGARHAGDPFGVGKLRGEVFGLAQLQIGRARRGSDIDGRCPIEVVADRAHPQVIVTGRELRRREAVAAASVAHDRDADARTRALGAHQHAFHRPFLGRGDLSAQRDLRGGRCARLQQQADGQRCKRTGDHAAHGASPKRTCCR